MSVIGLFNKQVTRRPGNTAIVFEGRRLTYAELASLSDRVACALHKAGVTRESLVAVFIDRSPGLVAALMGVWKAGGAYLPVDASYPSHRLSFILEDSQARFVLTERSLLPNLPPTTARVICIEDVCFDSEDSTFIPLEPALDDLAYVIYTSGSTGRPKGVEIIHSGLLNTVEAIGRDLALGVHDVVLATATVAFDISNLEMYVPLTAGASLHIVGRDVVSDGRRLIEVIRDANASLVFGTPTSWRLLIEAGWQGNPRLQIITGGEVLPVGLARTLTKITRALWNHYGPTETSICATRERVLPNAEQITLGLPIDNVSTYVLDDDLTPVDPGEVGEIYIGGAGVGRRYLNRPELTQRAFLPDPFLGGNARMYKTGDLARLLPDGRLEFQGRADNQVKIRGFRIELEEIEALIREYDGVHAAVLQLVEYGPGDQRLVAYYLSENPVSPAQMREFLRERLPFYMIPAEFIELETLPMNINGKVDREALNAIRLKADSHAEVATRAADDLESQLGFIWQRLLKISNISPSDNFFELGGHSLLAARMFTEIEKKTGRRIPLSVLLANPTIHELAAYIRGSSDDGWPTLVTIREKGSRKPLFIAHGLGGSLLLFRELAEQLGPEQPVYGIQLAAGSNATQDELSLVSLASRNVGEIIAKDPEGPYNLAGHSLGGLMVMEIAAQLIERGKKIGVLALLDCDFHVAQRPENTPPPEAAVPLSVSLGHTRDKLARFFNGNMLDMVRRKIIYERLMFRIWLLRRLHKEGSYYPHLFGVDPYIALYAERHETRPIDQNVVLYVAKDQPRPMRDFGAGWKQVVRGQLDILKIPGTHQTMFTQPNVSILAKDLAVRLQSPEAGVGQLIGREPSPEPLHTKLSPLFELHGG